MDKLSYKTLLIILFSLLIAIVILLRFFIIKPNSAVAAWWDDAWSYRKSISVNNTDNQQSNVYLTVTIDTSDSSKFQSDCGDIRFTDQNNNLLDYFIVSGCGSDSTVIHVNFPTLIAGNSTFYLYYGNSSAPNGFSLFDFATAATNSTPSLNSEETSPTPAISPIILGGQAGNPTPAPLPYEPLIYYKFDEGYGNTFKNYGSLGESLNGVFGTAGTIPAWIDGKYNKGLDFGTSSIAISSRTSSLLDYNATNGLTLSAWIKASPNETNGGHIISKPWTSGGVYNYSLFYSSTKRITFNVRTAATTYTLTTGITVPADQWAYVAATINPDTQTANIYINGVGITSRSDISNDFNITSNNIKLALGCLYPYPNSCHLATFQNFLGSIDEVKIYNVALTANQILQDYSYNQNQFNTSFGSSLQTISNVTTPIEYCIPGDTSFCIPPVMEWNFEEGFGDAIVDSGSNIGSTFVGTPARVTGKIGQAMSFDGSTNGIKISTTNTYVDETMSAWVYIDSSSPSGDIVGNCHTNNNSGYGFTFYLDGNTLRTKAGTNNKSNFYNNITYDVTNQKNKWLHLTMSWDNLGTGATGLASPLGCDTTVKLYVNGQLVDEHTDNLTATTGYTCTKAYAYPFSMGGTLTSSSTRLTKVKLDNVRVYNYVRTPAQVAYDYNKGGPVGWWKLNECQGSTAFDSSGLGNTGIISIGQNGSQDTLGTCQISTSAAWKNGASGKLNSSLNFDGTDDYINLGSITPNVNSVSFWTKPSSNNQYFLQLSNDSYITMSSGTISTTGFSSATIYINGKTTNLLPDNNWHHITIVTDTNIIPQTVYIGKAYSNYYSGQLDDIRFYNYPLTIEQVKILYNNGVANFN